MSNGNVLVVDDEDLMCDLIEQVLVMKDYSITTMISGTEALEEIKQKKDYDIIVADIRMPKVSGIDLLRASNEQNMNYQFILITGFYNLLAPDALESLKPFAFLKKPFDINLLIKTVEQAIQKKRDLDSGKSE